MVDTKGVKCKRVKDFYHCVIAPKGRFDPRSFRVKTLSKGQKLVVGCPKGKWSTKTKRCKVGTKAQKILKPVK